jgi:glycosyltransferase involved in cell wall biosynthesis
MAGTISLLIPCYNEEAVLRLFYEEACRVAAEMKASSGVEFEFLFVNDGSKDGTLRILRELHEADARVQYLSFSRNFGKEAAIYAGFSHCKGDYAAVIDADLQHPPSMLPAMYDGIVKEGYDCVAAKRSNRNGEPPIRSFFARTFYKLVNRISNVEMVDGATDFSMMTRQVVDSILSMEEYNRFSKGIYSWVGFTTKWLPYQNVERAAGQTKWSFWNLFLYSIDGILSFSTAPLAIASITGLLLCLIAFLIIITVVVKTILYGDPVAGFPTLICAICFIGGIQLFCLGIIGQYISKIYLEVKKRPVYLVKESSL